MLFFHGLEIENHAAKKAVSVNFPQCPRTCISIFFFMTFFSKDPLVISILVRKGTRFIGSLILI